MTVEPIPKSELQRAERRLARQIAAVIIQTMAHRDMSFEEIDARLGKRRGWSRRFVYRLADGDGEEGLKTLARLAYAMGVEVNFSITPIPFKESENDGQRGRPRGENSEGAAPGGDAEPAGG